MVKHETEKFFDMPAGTYCGVLLREKTAKKMQKLLYRHAQDVKRLLLENLDDIEVSDWTLVYPDGVQTVVKYFDGESTRENKMHRIDLFDKASRLNYCRDVFSSDLFYLESMEEVKKFATENLIGEKHE